MHTPRSFRAATLLLLGAGLAAAPAFAAECLPRVRDGWIRLGPAGMPMMAGFGRIENGCNAPATITAAASPAFGSIELHRTQLVDGISRMRAVPALTIEPGGAAEFAPGGMHLMLMRPTAPLRAGDRVALSFRLADGGELRGDFEVRPAGTR